jgi:hypothetical protein
MLGGSRSARECSDWAGSVAGVSVWAALSMPVRIGLFALMAHPREKSSFSCTLPLLIELLN